MKKLVFLSLLLLGFAAAFMAVLTTQRERPRPHKPVSAVLTPITGKLDIRSIDDLRVSGKRILLCGLAFAKPASMKPMVTDAARRDYQGVAVNCRRVGAGTPCDGKMAGSFGATIVTQCLVDGGIDLGDLLSDRGFLCDVPAQSGGHYKACSKP